MCLYIERPLIYVPQRTVLVNNGDSAVLVCQAEGLPQPNITWYRDGVQVQYSSQSLSVPLLYHSMGQIIKSVFVCLCVCMYVSVGTLTVAFFNRSSRNLVRTFESESEELIRLGSKSENAFTYFIPKNQNLADGRHLGFRFWAIMSAWINIFAPNFVQ